MNEDKAAGLLEQAKGHIKEVVGNATGNEKLANSGAADQVKGHAQETWGAVKDTASNLGARAHAETTETQHETSTEAHETGASVRDHITEGAAHLKDSIKRGLDHLGNKDDHR